MSGEYIMIDGYELEIARTQQEINVGMTKYEYPSIGMLFILEGQYAWLTMDGMKFPLEVFFYDRDWNMLEYIYAYPDDPPRRMPRDAYYMIELAFAIH